MPDISVTCPKCETVTTVSEFVDASAIACGSCGEKLAKPVIPSTKPAPTMRRLKMKGVESDEDRLAKEDRVSQAQLRRQADDDAAAIRVAGDKKFHIGQGVLTWAVFLVVGGLMGAIKYGGILQPDYGLVEGMLADYGWIIIVAFYLLILLSAFRDTMFQGMLCLLIPPYTFYYLFMVSDDFYMRAVFGGLLVGIGEDAARVFGQQLTLLYAIVDQWILTGGG